MMTRRFSVVIMLSKNQYKLVAGYKNKYDYKSTKSNRKINIIFQPKQGTSFRGLSVFKRKSIQYIIAVPKEYVWDKFTLYRNVKGNLSYSIPMGYPADEKKEIIDLAKELDPLHDYILDVINATTKVEATDALDFINNYSREYGAYVL